MEFALGGQRLQLATASLAQLQHLRMVLLGSGKLLVEELLVCVAGMQRAPYRDGLGKRLLGWAKVTHLLQHLTDALERPSHLRMAL